MVMTSPLTHVLSLAPVGNPADHTFLGLSSPQPHGRVFGGQVLAQALTSAANTVEDNRPVHSMHAYFLRPGQLDVPIHFAVDILRDGTSFSARRVQALQDGVPILSMIASFQQPGSGPDHHSEPPVSPPPATLPSTAELMEQADNPIASYWAHERPIDIRHADSPIYFAPAKEKTDDHVLWLKAPHIDGEQNAHRAILAFASDYTLLESVLKKHGMAWVTPGFKAASLDHAMWFHRPFRADEWIICQQHSPSASGARALVRAEYFTMSGTHVATATQELMMRVS